MATGKEERGEKRKQVLPSEFCAATQSVDECVVTTLKLFSMFYWPSPAPIGQWWYELWESHFAFLKGLF